MSDHEYKAPNQTSGQTSRNADQAVKKPENQAAASEAQQFDPLSIQRAAARPHAALPQDILGLQSAVGNRAAGQLVQAKLSVGPASDPLEREADQAAAQIGNPSYIARITDSFKKKLSTGANTSSDASPDSLQHFEGHLQSQRGKGVQLPEPTRKRMESHLGSDFSRVRIHADSDAGELSHNLQAEAFTHGRDIYMAKGRYRPETQSGQKLLAHELTHVVQQDSSFGSSSEQTVQRKKGLWERLMGKKDAAPAPAAAPTPAWTSAQVSGSDGPSSAPKIGGSRMSAPAASPAPVWSGAKTSGPASSAGPKIGGSRAIPPTPARTPASPAPDSIYVMSKGKSKTAAPSAPSVSSKTTAPGDSGAYITPEEVSHYGAFPDSGAKASSSTTSTTSTKPAPPSPSGDYVPPEEVSHYGAFPDSGAKASSSTTSTTSTKPAPPSPSGDYVPPEEVSHYGAFPDSGAKASSSTTSTTSTKPAPPSPSGDYVTPEEVSHYGAFPDSTQKPAKPAGPAAPAKKWTQTTPNLSLPMMSAFQGETTRKGIWGNMGEKPTYYQPEGQENPYQVSVENGKLKQGGSDLDTHGILPQFSKDKSHRHMFTMTGSGAFHSGEVKKGFKEHGRVHHTTMTAGSEVAAAGEMQVSGGKLEAISDASGHYRPGAAMTYQALKQLGSQGVDTEATSVELAGKKKKEKALNLSATELMAYQPEMEKALHQAASFRSKFGVDDKQKEKKVRRILSAPEKKIRAAHHKKDTVLQDLLRTTAERRKIADASGPQAATGKHEMTKFEYKEAMAGFTQASSDQSRRMTPAQAKIERKQLKTQWEEQQARHEKAESGGSSEPEIHPPGGYANAEIGTAAPDAAKPDAGKYADAATVEEQEPTKPDDYADAATVEEQESAKPDAGKYADAATADEEQEDKKSLYVDAAGNEIDDEQKEDKKKSRKR